MRPIMALPGQEEEIQTQPVTTPYLGPRPFEEKDAAVFYGRERESSDLCSLVIAHQEILLYAQSGAGKTSLLNAGLIPLLRKKGFRVFPPARVAGGLPPGVKLDHVSNLYVLNALATWVGQGYNLEEL